MRARIIGCVTLAVVLVAVAAFGAEPVKLLCGFEDGDAKAWGAKPDGDALLWKVGNKVYWFRKGDATQGDWAMAATRGQWLKSGKTRYNILRRGAILNTYRWPRDQLAWDWSGHDRLRLDVKTVAAAGRLRVEIEDAICQPAVRRTFVIPKGKWVTVEVDLAEAAKLHTIPLPDDEAKRLGVKAIKGRRLNLARMANIEVYLEQLDAKSEIKLDNLRLVAVGAKARSRHPVVRDPSPFLVPQHLPSAAPEPAPVAAETKRVEKPVIRDVDLSKARKTGYDRLSVCTRRALVTFGQNRMLLGFLAGYVHALQTADAGTTWTGLDGKPEPTRCYHNANAPAHSAAAAGTDLLYAYTDYCAGGGNPSNMFFRRIPFAKTGWQLGPLRLLDVDCRHCPEWKIRLLQLAGGRVWAVWMHLSRFGKLGVRARYSDDGGTTWRDPDSNAMVTVDRDDSQGPKPYGVTLWLDEPKDRMPKLEHANGRLGSMYAHAGLALTPYGERVACIWANTWHPNSVWSAFDGERWSKPKPVGRGGPGSAVTVGKTIYLTLHHRKSAKLLRLDGGKWTDDTPPAGKPGLLTASGETVFNVWTNKEGEKVALYICHKKAGGAWSKPELIARETLPGAGPRQRLGLAVPQYAPSGFLPVAWGPHHEWIRMTQWPVPAD